MIGSKTDALHARAQALENAYFAERDRQLADTLRKRLNADEMRRLLHYSLGLTDELASKGFAHLQTSLEVVAAMAVMPMVEIAWCDGEVSAAEKSAVLRGAAEIGIAPDSPLYQFLNNWLDQRPPASAMKAWRDYVKAYVEIVDPAIAAKTKENIIARTEKVARAAGGFLGMGDKISAAEQACLDNLAAAFD